MMKYDKTIFYWKTYQYNEDNQGVFLLEEHNWYTAANQYLEVIILQKLVELKLHYVVKKATPE